MSTTSSYIIDREEEFLKFLKGRYHFFHLSNVFFRDLHYGVMGYLDQQKVKHTYPSAEDVTREVVVHFEDQKIFHRIDERTWLLHYPKFKAISAKKPAPARPAVPRPAAAAPTAKAAPASAPPVPSTVPAANTETSEKKAEAAAPGTSTEAKPASGTRPATS